MKKILFISALFFSFLSGFSQVPIGCPTCTTDVKGILKVDSLFLLPLRNDTLVNPGRPGALVTAYGKTWLYMGTSWGLLTGISWGNIPGNITTQTDLMVLLNAKQNQITNGYAWKLTGGVGNVDTSVLRKVDTVVKVNDSTLGFKINGGTQINIVIRGSASGTVVNAISISAPPALFSSPVIFTNSAGSWNGTLTIIPQSANTVWAGPVSGSADTARFRQLVTADLPSNIPIGNLNTPYIYFNLDNTGTTPNWDVTQIYLGGTAVLHIPFVNPSSSGIATPTNYNFWSSKVDSTTQSNDSIYEWRNGIRYYRYFNAGSGGTPFDSLTTQGGIFHTGAYNDARYRTPLDTLYAHLLMSRNWGYKISDSLAALIAQKLTIGDTSYAHFLMTRAWGYKISDSIFAVVNAALALKRDITDTSYAHHLQTRERGQQVTDSLGAIIGGKVANYLGVSFLGIGSHAARPVSGTGLYYDNDSSSLFYVNGASYTNLFPAFNVSIRSQAPGAVGDSSYVKAVGGNLLLAPFRDSTGGCIHHVVNPDGSWTWYSTCMVNYGGAPGQIEGTLAGIPAATGYATGTTYIAQDSGRLFVDTGSGGSRGWKLISGGGSVTGGSTPDSLYTITSGSTATIPNKTNKVLINPASTLSALAITLPAITHASGKITFYFGGTLSAGSTVCSAISFVGNTGQTILQASIPGEVLSGDFTITYDMLIATKWYRDK